MDKKTEEILAEIKSGLRKIHGGNLKHLFLYGSYARGEAKAGSDIDLLLVLENSGNIWEEIQRHSKLVSEICLKYGVVLSLIPIKALKYDNQRTPLILNVKKEGISL